MMARVRGSKELGVGLKELITERPVGQTGGRVGGRRRACLWEVVFAIGCLS